MALKPPLMCKKQLYLPLYDHLLPLKMVDKFLIISAFFCFFYPDYMFLFFCLC